MKALYQIILFAVIVYLGVATKNEVQSVQAVNSIRGKSEVQQIIAKPRDLRRRNRAPKSIFDILRTAGGFKPLRRLVCEADLRFTLKNLGNFTVFGPDDEAFEALPKVVVESLKKVYNEELLRDLLLFHVVSGRILAEDLLNAGDQDIESLDMEKNLIGVVVQENGIFLQSASENDAQVIEADLISGNGIVHRINNVLIPPEFPPVTLYELAQSVEALSELVKALELAGLVSEVEELTRIGLTVFAPINRAFEILAKEILEIEDKGDFEYWAEAILDAVGKDNLIKVLLYHVAKGYFEEAEVVEKALRVCSGNYRSRCEKSRTVETFNERLRLKFKVENNMAFVLHGSGFLRESKILITNEQALNGIAHVIEEVMLPPNLHL